MNMECYTLLEMATHVIRSVDAWSYANNVLTLDYNGILSTSYWSTKDILSGFCRINSATT